MSDLEDVDLNWLRALSHLLETQSVTAAARRAGIGQPAMSRTLAHLREHFGDPLLVQVGRKLELTERAQTLRYTVQDALAAIRSALKAAPTFDPAHTSFEMRMSANDYAGSTLLSTWLIEARRKAPGLSVRIEPSSLQSIGMLAAGELDFGVGPPVGSSRLGLDRFVVRPLWEEHFVCAMRKKHPLARAPWNLETFLRFDHLLVTTGRPGAAAVDTALEKLGRKRRVAAVIPNFLLALPLLERSDLIATLPSRLFRTEGPLLLRKPPLAVASFTLYLAWHPRMTSDARHRWLRGSLLEHARGGAAATE